MAQEIGGVRVELSAGVAGLIEGMKQGADSLREFAAQAKTHGAAAAGGLNPAAVAAGLVRSAVMTMLPVASVAGVFAYAESLRAAADQAKELAAQLSVDVEALTALQHASTLAGLGQDGLTQAMERISRKVGEAQVGTKEAVDTFAALGLSWEDLRRLSPDQRLLAVVDALGKVTSETERSRLVFDLFGRGGGQVMKIVAEGADGLRASMQEAKELGIVVTKEQADLADELGDAWTTATAAVGGFFRELAVGMVRYAKGVPLDPKLVPQPMPAHADADLAVAAAAMPAPARPSGMSEIDLLQHQADMELERADNAERIAAAEAVLAQRKETNLSISRASLEGELLINTALDARLERTAQLMADNLEIQEAETTAANERAAAVSASIEDEAELLEFYESKLQAEDALILAGQQRLDFEILYRAQIEETARIEAERTEQLQEQRDLGLGAASIIAGGLADAVVHGKNLADTFRDIAQQLAVMIIRQQIYNALAGIVRAAFVPTPGAEAEAAQDFEMDVPGKAAGGPVQAHRAVVVGERGPEVFVPGVPGTIVPAHAVSRELLDALRIEPRAIGGPVSPNMAYRVGERGPELFVPGAPGTIVPTHALAAGGAGPISVTLTQHNNFRGADPGSEVRIMAALREREPLVMARAVRAVADLQSRGAWRAGAR